MQERINFHGALLLIHAMHLNLRYADQEHSAGSGKCLFQRNHDGTFGN